MMKKTIYILGTVLALSACSLKEDTSSLSVPGDFFRSYKECQSVLNGCYIPLKNIYVQTFYTVTECQSDIAYINYGTLDCRLDVSPTLPRFGNTVWTNGYLGVQRCNFAVTGIEASLSITEPQRIELLCEAKALRAMYYYTLTCMFGDVPFYFDDVSDFEVMDRIAVLPRMSAIETRATLIKDLQQRRRPRRCGPLLAPDRQDGPLERLQGRSVPQGVLAGYSPRRSLAPGDHLWRHRRL